MRRTKANDCQTLPFETSQCFAALIRVDEYSQWWPGEFRIRVLKATPDYVGSQIEVRPFGSRFVCEFAQLQPYREIVIHYVAGAHRGTGRWTLEEVAEGSRLSYEVDLEPNGFLLRLLSNWIDFAGLHSQGMAQVFRGLEGWLGQQVKKT